MIEVYRSVHETGRLPWFIWPHRGFRVAKPLKSPLLELTYNWDPEVYTGGRNFGHLAFQVEDIYAICESCQRSGTLINSPATAMAFIRSPDGISIELLPTRSRPAAARTLAIDAQYRRLVI